MELNREQIIKALECCVKVGRYRDAHYCNDCPLHEERCALFLPQNALSLINELTEENERLRAEKDTLDILVKDLRFRNKELQRCNEGLAKEIKELEIENDKVREAYADYEETTGLKQIKAKTVRKMQERLKTNMVRRDGLSFKVVDFEAIDRVAAEMLDGE